MNAMNMNKKCVKRYRIIPLAVKIKDYGRGMTQEQIDKICSRIKKIAKGRSAYREVFIGDGW